jgi:hypothetical protein
LFSLTWGQEIISLGDVASNIVPDGENHILIIGSCVDCATIGGGKTYNYKHEIVFRWNRCKKANWKDISFLLFKIEVHIVVSFKTSN